MADLLRSAVDVGCVPFQSCCIHERDKSIAWVLITKANILTLIFISACSISKRSRTHWRRRIRSTINIGYKAKLDRRRNDTWLWVKYQALTMDMYPWDTTLKYKVLGWLLWNQIWTQSNAKEINFYKHGWVVFIKGIPISTIAKMLRN